MTYSKMVVLATVGVLTLGLSGCGTSGPAASGEKVTTMPSAEAPAGLTQVTFVEEISAAQSAATTAHMTMTYSGAGAEAAGLEGALMEADIDLTDLDSPAMAMRMDIGGAAYDLIRVADEIYLNTGGMASGTYFSVTEAGRSDHPKAAFFAGMGEVVRPTLDGMDPTAQLDGMEGAITLFELTGTEMLDGIETDVYTLIVDPAKATGPQTDGIPEFELAKLRDIEVVYNVDKDNLPRRMVMTVGAESEKLVTTGTFSAWGEALDIVVPTGDRLISIEELPEGVLG